MGARSPIRRGCGCWPGNSVFPRPWSTCHCALSAMRALRGRRRRLVPSSNRTRRWRLIAPLEPSRCGPIPGARVPASLPSSWACASPSSWRASASAATRCARSRSSWRWDATIPSRRRCRRGSAITRACRPRYRGLNPSAVSIQRRRFWPPRRGPGSANGPPIISCRPPSSRTRARRVSSVHGCMAAAGISSMAQHRMCWPSRFTNTSTGTASCG